MAGPTTERFVDLDRSHGPLFAALPVRLLGQPHARLVAEGLTATAAGYF